MPEKPNPQTIGEETLPETKAKKPLTQELDLEALFKKAQELSPEAIKTKMEHLNQIIKPLGQDHEIKVCVDPAVHTWACARTPKKEVQRDGSVVDTNYFQYFIAMPYEHLAIEDEEFILGELRHELGHALYTDWKLLEDLRKTAEKEGYPGEAMGQLINCIEDPRMEHVSTFPKPLEGHVRRWFWAKNKQLILPNIGNNMAKGHPTDQFDLLIKLQSLWKIHSEEAEAEGFSPWDGLSTLNPKVQAAWAVVAETVKRITGTGETEFPEMRSSELKKAILSTLWPAKKSLIDEFGMGNSPESEAGHELGMAGKSETKGQSQGSEKKSQKPEPGEGNEGGGNEKPGPEGKPGKPSQPATPDKRENPTPGNPDDLKNLPPEVRRMVEQEIEKYLAGIEQQRQEQIEQNQKAEQANRKIDEDQQKRLEKKDGIRTPELRRQYLKLSREARFVTLHMGRLFEKYFPRVAFPRDTYGQRGKKYSAREHLKRYGTGLEKPMATANVPEKAGFALQLIVDVSGSMKSGRIDEVVKTVIGILEAAKDYPINIEILASDDKNGGTDPQYILKAFHEEFSGASGGRIKERLIGALTAFGGGNDDVASLAWAIPRIEAMKQELKADYDKVAALTIFLSDAEAEGQQKPEVVEHLRKKIPILGGCIEPDPKIKVAVEKAYGPIGEGSFCPDSLDQFPGALEKVLRKKISKLFKV
jgi:hypothetical protein